MLAAPFLLWLVIAPPAPTTDPAGLITRVPADSLPRALRQIETSSERPRDRAEAALMLGRLYYARGEYRGAADAFSRAAARLEPERKTEALYWAGMSWLAVRAPNAARSALEVVAASHSPFQPQARLAIARAWDLSSQPDRAFEVLEELLADSPAEAEPAALELYAAMADKLHRPAVAERARARLQSAYPLSMEAAAVGAEPQAAARTANAGPAVVEAGRFTSRARARTLASRAVRAGFSGAHVEETGDGVSRSYHVVLGSFPSKSEAHAAVARASRTLGVSAHVAGER
jgi:tetratricopeptide (TPR) repeat protein